MSENFIGFGDTNRTTNNQSGSSAAPTESSVNTETKEKQTKETVETNKSEESISDFDHDTTVQTPTPSHKIKVHVTDKHAPIIMFFGAPSSGKTMTLVRLAKYLRTHGYTLNVDPNFCTNAWEYRVNSQRFNSMLATDEALKGTDHNDFLFIQVKNAQGAVVCQILEGAGEGYFPSSVFAGYQRAQIPFPAYMASVFGSDNKKVWVFITEPNWERPYEDKLEYVERIRFCKSQYSVRMDKFILLFNKIDRIGDTTEENAMQACSNEYEGLFNAFRNHSPLASLFGPKYIFKFVRFTTGTYGVPQPGIPAHYTPSRDNYPAALWNAIIESIKG